MPETFQTLPDGKRIVVFQTSSHPDISGEANIQEGLKADIPTYQVTADNVVPASGKNLLTVFNNISGVRIRVQQVYAYARASGNNSMVIQLGYINSVPVSGTGTTASAFTGFATDFPPNPTPPNNIVHMIGNTTPAPVSNVFLGGNRLSLSTPNSVDIFNANNFRNGSALQLKGGQDGVVVKQMDGGALGAVTIHAVFALD
jgi:hypothetical protein